MIFQYETPNYFKTVARFNEILEKLKEIGVSYQVSDNGFSLTAPYSNNHTNPPEIYTLPEELEAYYNGLMDGVNYEKFRDSKPDIWIKKDLMQK